MKVTPLHVGIAVALGWLVYEVIQCNRLIAANKTAGVPLTMFDCLPTRLPLIGDYLAAKAESRIRAAQGVS